MDRDLTPQPRRRRRSRPQQPADQFSSSSLPEAVGNRTFSRLATGGVDRAALRPQGAGPLDPDLASAIEDARGVGAQLPAPVQQDMEQRLGADLSDVRVHTGNRAADLNRAVSADAFTTGSDVFFGDGNFEPGTDDGKRLLAHELTHVVQQRSGDGGGDGRVSAPDDPHEVHARQVADAAVARQAAGEELEEEGLPLSVARQAAGEELEEEGLPLSVARQAAGEELEEEELR